MPDLRRRLRSVELPSRDDLTGRKLAGLASRVLFVVLLIAAVAISLSADIIAVAILASVLVAQMLYVLFPMDEIRGKARSLWTGEAGEEAYEELEEGTNRIRR